MKEYLEKLAKNETFSEAEMQLAVKSLLENEITDSEIAAFLFGLKLKGETIDEITGIVSALREKAPSFSAPAGTMDNCGTGGDGSQSFNVSTTSAFVIAGAGIPVAKHGNRSVSSKTGSSDVLEYLGVNLNLSHEAAEELLQSVGITFLFAPNIHRTMKRVMIVRKSLKIPTIFNLIGPLTNPVQLDYQMVGMYRRDLLPMFANVLKRLGRKRAVLLNGAGYMDEASLQGENHLVVLENGEIIKKVIQPEQFDLPTFSNDSIKGGSAKDNSEILQDVLQGNRSPYYYTVLLNAGIGIYTGGKASSIEAGIQLAKESIDSGAALHKLNELIENSCKYEKEVI
ncbi:anthranilate phosphoribosyltransferase [Bacillus aquiflavi]|uniref:Anthranilate phosphoribosyltransferase n=1 Tax=Bacillus aquiflavi TaxID=2672567 RepID=A0A6B3W1S1_9BACI|nr:anthranilate phosphoribosyltransferase [Bacillus aquiflavi]MBA4537152.1 anthranilate phosphoribosyltransferase [Bacillus aquiflavi]NEY82427.1 anthranilate phosphoribosyltransferase [Bacillus aquiflavi]UAC49776.1 anthranilate phosphoribosyltransferase [Bacillus aquiflavi]